MINLNKPFFLYTICQIQYKGRAKSTLELGKYVILHKSDGSIAVHGASLLKPLNFQPPGAKLTLIDNKLISTRGKETLYIEIIDILHYHEILNWSDNKINITMTEKDLRNKIISNLNEILKINAIKIIIEYQTDYGSVDLVIISDDEIYHVIEIKRGKANISGCTQLARYLHFFNEKGIKTIGYIMSPLISENALKYSQKLNIKWIQVSH